MSTPQISNAASCIDACLAAAVASDRCANACLREAEVAQLTRCIVLDHDCALLCKATASLISHGSPFARGLSELCASACDACAEECEKHAHHHHCKACAAACRRAADECRRYARHAQ